MGGIGRTNAGGGAALNFKVVGYATEEELNADTPKENTIGVITTTPITSWAFSATEPKEPEVGMVWICVGDYSSVWFNALKNNTLQVYPLSAKQYVNNALVDVPAQIYQGGEWKSFALILFPENGHTGQWVAKEIAGNSNQLNDPVRQAPNISLSDSEMTITLDTSGTSNYRIGSVFYDEPISFKNKNTITVTYSFSLPTNVEYSGGFVRMKVGKTMVNGYEELATVDLETGNNKTTELPVSGISDVDAYIAFEVYTGRTKATCSIKDIRVS